MNNRNSPLGLFFLCVLPLALRAQSLPSYSDVMLVVNDSSQNSIAIGDFFAQRRHIPAKNIFHIQIDTNTPTLGETLDSATFKNKVWWNMEHYMQVNNLVDSINYIVTTKGCPLRVVPTLDDDFTDTLNDTTYYCGIASFNDCLALLNGADSIYVLTQKADNFAYSRYYGSTAHFQHNQVTMPYYLTTRLDGYTVAQIESYIMKAESTVVIGEGLFVLDEDPTKTGEFASGNEWMAEDAAALEPLGFNVLLNTDTVYVTQQNNVIGYVSWGSNDAHAAEYAVNAVPGNQYLNGSLGETYVSSSARSFNVGTGYGQSLIADWIAEGISGIKGYTDEPYLEAIAEPDLLFPMYEQGFNMAESYWSASPLIAWRQVVIGDPKMALHPTLTPKTENVNLGVHQRYVAADTQVVVYNSSAVPVTIAEPINTGNLKNQISAYILRTQPFPITLNPGDSMVIGVTCTPVTFDTLRDTLTIPYSVPDNPNSLFLQPVFTCVSSLLKFITVTLPEPFTDTYVGDTTEGYYTFKNNAAKDTFEITNTGISDPSDFIVAHATPNDTVRILPDSTYKVPVWFTPRDTGQFEAHLEPVTNASLQDELQYFGIDGYNLIAVGTALSRFAATAESLNFGVCQRYRTVDSQVVLRNAIFSPMTIMPPWNTGDTLHQIVATIKNLRTYPFTLNPGDSLVIAVTCTPDSIESVADTIVIPYTVPGNPTVKYFREGFSCTASLLNFISITLPDSLTNVFLWDTAESTFTFRNNAARDTLILSHVGISDSLDFTFPRAGIPDSIIILPGTMYQLPVLFIPQDTSPHQGHLSPRVNTSQEDIKTYIGTGGVKLRVFGAGISPFATSAGAVNIGVCQRYVQSDTQVVLYNSSPLPLNVFQPWNSGDTLHQIVARVANASSFPVTMSPGDSLIISVVCTPVVIATIADTFNIPYTMPGFSNPELYRTHFSCISSLMNFVPYTLPAIFPGVAIGDTAEGFFTFHNATRMDSVIFTDIAMSDSTEFFLARSSVRDSVIIFPGMTDSLPVWFAPRDTGEFQAHLNVIVANTTLNDQAEHIGIDGSYLIVTGIGGTLTAVAQPVNHQALSLALGQNYPNPFTDATAIVFTLPGREGFALTVTDVLGRTVATLATGLGEEGPHVASFDARTIPSGVYFYTLSAGNSIRTRLMQIVK